MKKMYQCALGTLLTALLLTGCAKDPKLTKFESDVEYFCTQIAKFDQSIDQIDADADTAIAELMEYLDEIEMSFQHFAELDFPAEYDYLEASADEAESYMVEAVKSYHEAFADNSYNASIGQYAQENYARAMKRIQIILAVLRGEEPSLSEE